MRTARSINKIACCGSSSASALSAADNSAKVALVLVVGAAGLGVDIGLRGAGTSAAGFDSATGGGVGGVLAHAPRNNVRTTAINRW